MRPGAGHTTGTLYLIPTPLGDTPVDAVLPAETLRIVTTLADFVVEHAKTARAFLKQVGTRTPLQELRLNELNEHTAAADLEELLAPLLAGRDVGVLSEAGCPGIADPGAELARLAHRRGLRVKPLVGPSSILLALMGSGLVGQRFTFHGYLPAKPEPRREAIRDLERRAARDAAAQVCIETPYRNAALYQALLDTCRDDTLLGIARQVTTAAEFIATRRIDAWRAAPAPELDKRPCVFLIGSDAPTPR
jgi:16S rRNA (cytidine1402-2'-O)-methyltransferase